MTAHAGDALSHVNFNWPSRRFSRDVFKAISKEIFQGNFQHRPGAVVTFLPPSTAASRPVGDKLDGSFRICMGAMSLRNRPNPVPRRLLAANFTNLMNTLFFSIRKY